MAVFTNCNKDVAVTEVKLNETSLTLGVTETKTLIATVLPEKATNKAVAFTSSNPIVATVLPNGLVTGITKGEATILVTTADGGFTASCQVKVEDISVIGISLNKTTLSLEIGSTETLIATVQPESATNKTVIWTSSDLLVATVVNGFVTAIGNGLATITATTFEGNFTATCGGNVTNDGNGTVAERGICWSTSQNPTINDNKAASGSGTGSFTGKLTGLSVGNTYYVRAYATNSAGTAYGEQRSFAPKFAIGDNYQGGIVAYVDNSGEHGFIVTPSDNPSRAPWHNGSNILIGGTGTAIGTGKSNTEKIVQVQGQGNYAAKICDNLTIGGYNDWYLPSKDELNELYKNHKTLGGFGYDNINTAYWSSSEFTITRAWNHSFYYTGSQFDIEKNQYRWVRCIRSF